MLIAITQQRWKLARIQITYGELHAGCQLTADAAQFGMQVRVAGDDLLDAYTKLNETLVRLQSKMTVQQEAAVWQSISTAVIQRRNCIG